MMISTELLLMLTGALGLGSERLMLIPLWFMLVMTGGSLRLMLTPLWLTLQFMFMLTFTLLWFTFFMGFRPMLILMEDWFRYFRQERLMFQLRLLMVCQISLAPLLLPSQLQTFLIMVSVRARPALSPQQTSCQSLVLLSRFKASLWLLSLAQQVAMFLKISCTIGMPQKRQLQKSELQFCRFLNFLSASLILPCFMSASPKQFQALKYSSINLSFSFLMLEDDQSCSWMAWAALLSPFFRCSSSKWTNPTNLKCSSLMDLYSLSASQKSSFSLQASPRRMMYLFSSDSGALTFFRYSTFLSQTSKVSLKQPDICRMTA